MLLCTGWINRIKKLHSDYEIGAVERVGIRRSTEGSADEDPYAVEEANYLNE